MVTVSFEENKESQVHVSVNVVISEDPQDPEDRSSQNQTNTTNTSKDNGRKGRPRKNKGISDNNKYGEEGNEKNNPSNSEDGCENHGATSIPPDNIELLRNHIEMQDEELVKQRELLMAVLKQNEELANTIKALQEHMNLNTDTNKVKGSHQISINVDSKNQKGGDGSNTNAGPNNPRVTFHSHVNPEPEYQGVTKK
jgi:hypothetical protein